MLEQSSAGRLRKVCEAAAAAPLHEVEDKVIRYKRPLMPPLPLPLTCRQASMEISSNAQWIMYEHELSQASSVSGVFWFLCTLLAAYLPRYEDKGWLYCRTNYF